MKNKNNDFVEDLKKYFDETPEDEIISTWNKSAYLDENPNNITVKEFLKLNKNR